MNPNPFRERFEKGYLIVLILLLMKQLLTFLDIPFLKAITPYINVGILALTLMVLAVEQPWHFSASVLLLAGIAWILIESCFWGIDVCKEHLFLMNEAAEAYVLFFSVGLCIREKREKSFLYAVLCIWTLLTTLLAAAALWATVSGTRVYSFSGKTFLGIDEGQRLSLFVYCTISASILAISALLAVLGALVTKSWIGRIAFLLCVPVQFLALSMTDGRTGAITLGFGLGLVACLMLIRFARNKPACQRVAAAGLCLIALAGCTAGAYLAMPAGIKLVNSLIRPGERIIDLRKGLQISDDTPSSGNADAPDTPAADESNTAQHRSILSGDMLSGRTYVWRAAIEMFKREPLMLIKGTSVLNAMKHVLPYSQGVIEYAHVHNIYLQVLVETGVIGFGLMAAFLFLFAKAALTLFFAKGQALWIGLLPIPALMIALGEMVEGLTLLEYNTPALTFFFLSAGFTIGHARRLKKL